MEYDKLNLNDIFDLLPEELVERHGIENMDEDLAKNKAIELLKKRTKLGYKKCIGYHTSDILYNEGENINPILSKGNYKGKIFFSRDIDCLYKGDYPKYCYQIETEGAHNDPEDLTGKDWFYTLTPAKVIKKIEEW